MKFLLLSGNPDAAMVIALIIKYGPASLFRRCLKVSLLIDRTILSPVSLLQSHPCSRRISVALVLGSATVSSAY